MAKEWKYFEVDTTYSRGDVKRHELQTLASKAKQISNS
jgi:hypothetical protein